MSLQQPERKSMVRKSSVTNKSIPNKKQEVEIVTKRVEETKKEIEHLKTELQKLINRGINKTFTKSTDTVNENTSPTEKADTCDIFKNIKVNRANSSKIKGIPLDVTKQEKSPRKIRHYDQAEAREFIKKQRDKRLEQLKENVKEKRSVVDTKKQKLQDLHKKSMELLSKNIQFKRHRSKSREKIQDTINTSVPDLVTTEVKIVNNSQKEPNKLPLKLVHQNITVRNNDYDINQIPKLEVPSATLITEVHRDYQQKCHNAAVKIQAAFKGYQQRKLDKLKKKLIELVPKLPETKIQNTAVKETQTVSTQLTNDIPPWLQKNRFQPYPYNFISTVKRKLNLIEDSEKSVHNGIDVAIQSSFCEPLQNGIDVAIQSSFVETDLPVVKQNEKKCFSSKGTDLKSFLSHKCLNLDLEKVESLHLVRKEEDLKLKNDDASDYDTSKNIPDISTETSIDSQKHSIEHTSNKQHTNEHYFKFSKEEIRLHSPQDKNLIMVAPSKSVSNEIAKSIENSNLDELMKKSVGNVILKQNDMTDDISTQTEYSRNLTAQSCTNKTNTEKYSNIFSSAVSTVLSLKRPSISLENTRLTSSDSETASVKNINLKVGEKRVLETEIRTNKIHLKFEAELHLLNEFNESLRQVMAVEKSLLELQNKKLNNNQVFQNRDTQTSFVTKSSSVDTNKGLPTATNASSCDTENNKIAENSEILDNQIAVNGHDKSFASIDLSQLDDSLDSSTHTVNVSSLSSGTQYNGNNHIGLSLGMFEQLIKDEDARIENLKAVLKIRQKALFDRTKGEIAWLEVQKKHLRDSGQFHQVSLVKKKQRGILIKLQHERHEMQRLKQMQKIASRERKTILKQQHSMIKAQLSTNNMNTKIKRNSVQQEKRLSGPLKVYSVQSCSETITETSISAKDSVTEEIFSVTSQLQSFSEQVQSETENHSQKCSNRTFKSSNLQVKTDHVKKSLLMREAALQKRRKAAEELLQWHQRLLEEERKISELESAVSSIINQVPSVTNIVTQSNDKVTEKYKLRGVQLNSLWFNMTGREEKKFKDDEMYSASKIGLERFCKDAKKLTNKKKNNAEKIENFDTVSSNSTKTDNNCESELVLHVLTEKSKSTSQHDDVLSDSPDTSIQTELVQSAPSIENNNKNIEAIQEYLSDFNTITLVNESLDHTDSEIATSIPSTPLPLENHLDLNNSDIVSVNKEADSYEPVAQDLDKSIDVAMNCEISDYMKIEIVAIANVNENLADDENEIKLETLPSEISEPVKVCETEQCNSPNTVITHSIDEYEIIEDEPLVFGNEMEVPGNESDKSSEVIVEQPSTIQEKLFNIETSLIDDNEPNESNTSENISSLSGLSEPIKEQHSIIDEILLNAEASLIDNNDDNESNTLENVSLLSRLNENISEKVVDAKDNTESPKSALDHSIDIEANVETEEDNEILTTEKVSIITNVKSLTENIHSNSMTPNEQSDKKSDNIDVKKRVSEILADAHNNSLRADKSPKLQNLYVTAYDVNSPSTSPELDSSCDDATWFGTEAEIILKKQLLVEQEIKAIEEQQKEQLPYLYLREIPNKPPPPYTPPISNQQSPTIQSVLPKSVEQIDVLVQNITPLLYKAYLDNSLQAINLTISKKEFLSTKYGFEKNSLEFIFGLCKEITINHYKEFKMHIGPSWMQKTKKPKLAMGKALDKHGLEKFTKRKLKEILQFENSDCKQKIILKWSRKKRDHVDELLLIESQAEEAEWTNYNEDELIVKNELTSDILNMLIVETAETFNSILTRKTSLY